MITSKILSGEQLVEKGTTKLGVSLPELGLKDVLPNGSWLEQKQVQSALEARKHLIEVERIEKCGVLSHAKWREDLMLAEVTQKVGGYWQYMGHNVGKHLFLYPEEALFLMETNCLQLKLNDVTVSLQQAYSLLLRGNVCLHKFRVYSSLSRLGYKLLRHTLPQATSHVENIGDSENAKETFSEPKLNIEPVEIKEAADKKLRDEIDHKAKIVDDALLSTEDIVKKEDSAHNYTVEESEDIGKVLNSETANEMEWEVTESNEDNEISGSQNVTEVHKAKNFNNGLVKRHSKLPRLFHRKTIKQFSTKDSEQFRDFPDLLLKEVVTIDIPSSEYLPRNVMPKNKTYVLNLENIKSKTTSEANTNDNRTYSYSDEVNGNHIRRVRNVSYFNSHCSWAPNYFSNTRFQRGHPQYRPFSFWQPRNNSNYFRFNLIFQRPYFPMYQNILPRFNFFARPPQLSRSNLFNNFINNEYSSVPSVSRKRPKSSRKYLLSDIKKLASKLRHLIQLGNTQIQHVEDLQSLVNTYNARYNTKLVLTDQFEIVENENIVDTIELDDDEESKSKKPKLDKNSASFDDNLNALKKLALKLKKLEKNEGVCTRRRRAFNKAIRTFNKSYNAEIYVNCGYELIDKRHIILDSSSDSDCVIEEPPKTGKLLKNPFNILKRLSKNRLQTSPEPSTSSKINSLINENERNSIERKYSDITVKTFKRDWLPNEEDFGRAEVPTENHMISRLIDTKQEEYFYEFITNPYNKFDNWLSYKIAFWEKLEESQNMIHKEIDKVVHYNVESIIKPEDCTETSEILKKLSIIKPMKSNDVETSLTVDYDVYKRDVQNFKKTCLPKPHFRLICNEESTDFPSAAEVAGLYSRHQDEIGIVFAIVGASSISYLQIIPTETPLYLPNTEIQ